MISTRLLLHFWSWSSDFVSMKMMELKQMFVKFWRQKTWPHGSWIELDFGRRTCFYVCVNQKWWLTDWRDGRRRTLESELTKVSWLSTTCVICGGGNQYWKSQHFAPETWTDWRGRIDLDVSSWKKLPFICGFLLCYKVVQMNDFT